MLTIDLSDEQITAFLKQLPEARRDRILEPFANPESGEWILEDVPGNERMDAETFAAVQEGLDDMVAGRLHTPQEVREYVLGNLASRGIK